MTDEEINAEYYAAKAEYEEAEAVLARASHRLRLAGDACSKVFDRQIREADSRIAARKGAR